MKPRTIVPTALVDKFLKQDPDAKLVIEATVFDDLISCRLDGQLWSAQGIKVVKTISIQATARTATKVLHEIGRVLEQMIPCLK